MESGRPKPHMELFRGSGTGDLVGRGEPTRGRLAHDGSMTCSTTATGTNARRLACTACRVPIYA